MRHKKRKKRKSPDLHVVEQDIPADDTTYRVDLSITVKQAYYLRPLVKSSKSATTMVRYTRCAGLPGAGEDVVSAAVHEVASPAYELSTTYTGVAVTEELLNGLVAAPLEVTVVEVVKKHKVPIGVARIPLDALVRGELAVDVVVPIEPIMHASGPPLPHASKRSRVVGGGGGRAGAAYSPTTTVGGYDDDDGDEFRAEVDGELDPDSPVALLGGRPGLAVTVAVSAPLQSAAEWEASRILHLTLPGIFSLPPSCLAPEPAYRFTLTAALPSTTRIPQIVVFPDSEVVVPAAPDALADADAPEFGSGSLPGAAGVYESDSFVSEASVESRGAGSASLHASHPRVVLLPEEQAAADAAARFAAAEAPTAPHVDTAGLVQRVFLGPAAASKLHELAVHNLPLKLEVRRSLGPAHAGVVDPNEWRYVGEALVPLNALLTPGADSVVERVRIAAPNVLPPDVAGESGEPGAGGDGRSGDGASKGHRAKGDRRDRSGRSGKKKERLELVPEDASGGSPYDAAETYVKVAVALSSPLVARPPTPKPVYSVRDFVPARGPPAVPPRPMLTAPEEFKAEVEAAVDELVESYRKVYGEQLLRGSFSPGSDGVDERKKRFVYELNATGAYFGLKEKLKGPVVRIVREKFQRTSPFASKAETQTFLNDLYMYLIDRMHEALNSVFASVHEIPIPTTVEDTGTLKRYAAEAEINGAYELAARHYQERIARSSQCVEFWYDYGVFCLRVGDRYKANECLREAIALDERNADALKVYGMLCACEDKFVEARAMLNAAVDVAPDAVSYGMLAVVAGLADDGADDPLWAAADDADARERGDARSGSVAIRVARALLAVHLPRMAERAVARDVVTNDAGLSVDVLLCRAEGYMQEGAYDRAEAVLRDVLDDAASGDESDVRARVHAMWGHLSLIKGEFDDARVAYEASLGADAAPSSDSAGGPSERELLAVYLRLGSLYVTSGSFAEAKYVYLKACEVSPSAFTWLGVGVSCYRLGELGEAEDALAEANILNNFDADVWGYLTLVCLKTGRVTEGDQAFMQALKLDLANGLLLTEIGEAYFEAGREADAEQCLRRSIELEESAHAHRVLAEVLNAQGQKEGAVAEYMMVLASAEAEDDLDASRAGLVEVLTRLGRGEQAEFYRKEMERVAAEREAQVDRGVEAEEARVRSLAAEFGL